LAFSCAGKAAEEEAVPPETFPLSSPHVGYGVISAMYARLSDEPSAAGATTGNARLGTVVVVRERRLVREGAGSASWLLVEGEFSGWIREDIVAVYANEHQARAASEGMR